MWCDVYSILAMERHLGIDLHQVTEDLVALGRTLRWSTQNACMHVGAFFYL